MINLIFKMYKNSEQRPLWRGKMKCILYLENYSKSEPAFTLGPDWKYAVMAFIGVNIITGASVEQLKHSSVMFHLCILSLVLWDTVHILLMFTNSGIAPRDPNIHADSYLQQI